MKYDIAIIGGGPAGYNAAEKAAENGLKTILFERNVVGGVCLNEGCIPTKTLLYSAKVLENAKTAYKYGVKIEDAPSFDLQQIILRKDKVVKQMTAGEHHPGASCCVFEKLPAIGHSYLPCSLSACRLRRKR